jgi:hypothetical protein
MSYPVARVATAVVSATAFFFVGLLVAWVFGGVLTHDVLQVQHARIFAAVGLTSTCLFAGHNAAVSMLEAFVQGRLRLPSTAGSPPLAALPTRPQNPWTVALWSLCSWGPLAIVASLALVPRLWPTGIALSRFALWYAAASGALALVIVVQETGGRFLRQARLPREQRLFAGSYSAYLWQRFVLPQALINAIINAWVGALIAPGRLSAPGATVTAAFVRNDVLGSAVLLALVMYGATRAYAGFELRWGVVPVLPLPAPGIGVQLLACLGLVALTTGVAWATLAALDIQQLGVTTFIVARAIGCGIYCGLVAYWSARWTAGAPSA